MARTHGQVAQLRHSGTHFQKAGIQTQACLKPEPMLTYAPVKDRHWIQPLVPVEIKLPDFEGSSYRDAHQRQKAHSMS